MDVPDGLPKWSKINDGEDSELIEDSPPAAVQELKKKRAKEAKEGKEGKDK